MTSIRLCRGQRLGATRPPQRTLLHAPLSNDPLQQVLLGPSWQPPCPGTVPRQKHTGLGRRCGWCSAGTWLPEQCWTHHSSVFILPQTPLRPGKPGALPQYDQLSHVGKRSFFSWPGACAFSTGLTPATAALPGQQSMSRACCSKHLQALAHTHCCQVSIRDRETLDPQHRFTVNTHCHNTA